MLGETVGTVNISTTGYVLTRSIALLDNGVTNTITEYPGTVITHIHLISTSGGGSVLTIANGQGGTTQINITGTTSKGIDFDFGVFGITFPSGAYVTVDGNISNASITCKSYK